MNKILFSLVLSFCCFGLAACSEESPASSPGQDSDIPVIELTDGQLFLPEILQAEALGFLKVDQIIRGAVGPHHLPTAASLLAGLYQTMASSGQEIETIVLIGPDHFDCVETDLITTAASYQTSLGLIRVDGGLVDQLLENGLAGRQDSCFSEEHAVYAHIPYIQKYLPQALLVPVLVREEAEVEQVLELGSWLAEHLSERQMVVLSTDWSHYQTVQVAAAEDEATLDIFQNLDMAHIYSGYFDVKAGAFSFFQYLSELGIDKGHLLYHANSAEFNDSDLNTTSYASWIYF